MLKRILFLLSIFALSLVLAGCVTPRKKAEEQLKQLFADAWEFRLRENPVFATSFGDHRFDAKLGSVSEADEERRIDQTKEFLQRLKSIPREQLSEADRMNYDIFQRLKENDIAEYKFRTYLMPITNRGGYYVSFPQLPGRVPLKTVRDYENYISRLNAFKRLNQQNIDLMREGIRQGFVLPKVVLKGIDKSIQPHIVKSAEKSLLYKPFRKFPDGFSPEDKSRLKKTGSEAILNSVVPAYRKLLDFMQKEYLPSSRQEIAAAALPNGREFYAHRVRYFTTLDITPEKVHQIGLSEVKRIRRKMEKIIKSTGFRGGFKDFVRFLRTDPRFYVKKPEQLMKEVSYVLKQMDGQLPKLFKTLPRMPYGIKPIPAYIAPKTTTAYYNAPAGDGTRAGFYFVNLYNLKSRPLYEIEALSYHEAVPGHHLQIALQQELKNIPNFRRFSGFTAFVEGWALYAEQLGYEVGFYQDPYSRFGQLTYEMWRACRLVVDTGMHSMGWTRQQAIDFMAENTALTLLNITNEVDRYIAWPGQALGYKMGQLKISELRKMATSELGPAFDLREFHDVVLGSGAVPLNILETNVKRWVAQVKQQVKNGKK